LQTFLATLSRASSGLVQDSISTFAPYSLVAEDSEYARTEFFDNLKGILTSIQQIKIATKNESRLRAYVDSSKHTWKDLLNKANQITYPYPS